MAKKEEAKVAEAEIVESKLMPVNSEKAFLMSHGGIYIFKVPAKMSKQAILRAVETEFKAKAVSATVLVRKGKMARAARGKKRLPIQIQRPDVRLAYVRLAKGERLPFFDEQIAAAKDAAKAEQESQKVSEKAEKKGKK